MILHIRNILSTSSILQQTSKHFGLHFLHMNWIWNVWLLYLSMDSDNATLTASVHQKTSPGFDGVSVLWTTYMLLFRMNLPILLSSVIHLKFYLFQKKSNCWIYVFQSSSFKLNSDTFPIVIDILLLFLVTICYAQIRNK